MAYIRGYVDANNLPSNEQAAKIQQNKISLFL